MQKIKFTKKAIAQAIGVGAGVVVLLLFGASEKIGIGQAYQSVCINGQLVGYTATRNDIGNAVRAARRELALESEERLCMEYTYETDTLREPFQTLLSENELKEALKGILKETVLQEKERVYTVAIDDYNASFSSLEDVETFLNRVKEASDEEKQFETRIVKTDASHISGILQAQLVEVNAVNESVTVPKSGNEVIPEITLADDVTAGANAAAIEAMEYAIANPTEVGYKTGILNMEFVETVQVYENYVDPEELSDIETEVVEVTKEKESNKIYEVVSGDCLSVIALDYDTTVASIVALNGLTNADAIREGQELIIAVPEPDLKIRITVGEVYEEDYEAEPIIIDNDSWYTTKEVIHEEGTTGHRERNDVVIYENGMETEREMIHENIMTESTPAVIERGTIIPPTYVKPISGGRFTSGFGRRWGRMHKGVDWACSVGTTVFASCGGTVIQASYNGGYGNNVVISHPDGRLTRYAHCSKLLVRVGQHVEQGEAIALSGNTGRSTGPHVHFEIYINGVAVNPLKYISN